MNAGFQIPGFEDVEQIGAGGFGRVFRARQPAFDRTVAVKLLNGRLDDAATLRRFQRECQALGAVSSHPNIVPVDAGGTSDGVPYLVMDFVRGGSLADRLARTGPVPWPDVAAIGVKLSGALHSAHAAGVLHRDIKPENVLVSGYGEPQLADFGIAQRAGIENRTTTAAAMTPSHTAPEQFGGGPPSESTDVYALASTLFTLLAAATPFQGRPDESIYALISRAATAPPPDLRPRGVPDALARVIEAGLAKDPAQRPPSALAFGRLIQQAQQSLGVGVTPLPVAQEDASGASVLGDATYPPGVGASGAVTPVVPADVTRPRPAGVAPPPPPAGPYGVALPTPSGGSPAGTRRWVWLVAAGVALVLAAVAGTALILRSGDGGTSAGGPSTSPAVPATASTTPTSTPDPASTTDAPTSDTTTSEPAETSGSSGGNASQGDPKLAALLVQPGQAPLKEWTGDPTGLLAGIDPGTTFLCSHTVDLGGGSKGSAEALSGDGSRVIVEYLYRVGTDRATRAMADLRAHASCGSWDAGGIAGTTTLSPGNAVTVGDESVAYRASGSSSDTYLVFFRRGGDFCVTTVVSTLAKIAPGDRELLAQVAHTVATRLAQG